MGTRGLESIWSMLRALECFTLLLPMMNTPDVARDSERQNGSMARQQRRWSTPGPKRELTADSIALICVRSGMLTTTTNVRSTNTSMESEHGKEVDLVDNQPLIVFWKSLSLSSPQRAKSKYCRLQDLAQSRQSRRMRVTMALDIRLQHQVSPLRVILRVKPGRL